MRPKLDTILYHFRYDFDVIRFSIVKFPRSLPIGRWTAMTFNG